MEDEAAEKLDFRGNVLILSILLLAFLKLTLDIEFINYLIAPVGLTVIGVYLASVRQIPFDTRSPISDSLIALSGLTSSMFVVADGATNLNEDLGNLFSRFHPFFGFIFLLTGIFTRLVLLDNVVRMAVDNLKSQVDNLRAWLQKSIKHLIQGTTLFLGMVIYFISFFITLDNANVGSFALIMLSIGLAIGFLTSKDNMPRFGWRFIAFSLGIFLIFIAEPFPHDPTGIGTVVVGIGSLLWSLSIYEISHVMIITYLAFRGAIVNFGNFLKSNKLLMLQVSLFFASIVSLIVGSNDSVDLGILQSSQKLVLGGLFLFISLTPNIFRFVSGSFPVFLHNIWNFTMSVVKSIGKRITQLFRWSKANKIKVFRIFSFGLTLIFYTISEEFLLGTIFLALAFGPNLLRFINGPLWNFTNTFLRNIQSFLVALKLYLNQSYIWISQNQVKTLRFFSFGLSILSLFVINDRQLKFGLTSLFLILAFLPTLQKIFVSFIAWLKGPFPQFINQVWIFLIAIVVQMKNLVESGVQWVSRNRINILRVFSLTLAVVFYYRLQAISRIFFSGLFFILAIWIDLVRLGRWISPNLLRFFIKSRQFLSDPSNLSGYSGLFILISQFVFHFDPLVNLILLLVAAILMTFGWNYVLQNIIDKISYNLLFLVFMFYKALTKFASWLNFSNLLLVLAWISLALAIFYPSGFREEFAGLGRIVLLILALFLWISARERRRQQFYRVLKGFTGSLRTLVMIFYRFFINLLIYVKNFVVQNLLVVVAWIVSIGFIILSLGLLLQTKGGPTGFIFPAKVIEDDLVSRIIGLSLFGMSILAIQQSFVKRTRVKFKVIK
ncbi:MAG: hypothetical protein IH840_07080 [Candidatus Heimdallarchaeota archaeon]|nr:hypothetical protein [Candidatus Heimdallarchaeota archaeon]